MWKNAAIHHAAAAAAVVVVAATRLLIDSDKPVTVLIIPRHISFTTKQLRNLSAVSNHIIINNVFAKSHKKLGTGGWLTSNLNRKKIELIKNIMSVVVRFMKCKN